MAVQMTAHRPFRTDLTVKLDAIKEFNQLRIKVAAYEKEKKTHIYNKHADIFKEFSSLQENELKMEDEHKQEKFRLQQQVCRIKLAVRKFRRELQDVKATPQFLEKIKHIMEDIESDIAEFKETQRKEYELLMADEAIVSQEVAAIEKKIETWGKVTEGAVVDKPRGIIAQTASARDVTHNLPPEVAEFEKFVEQSGGTRAGWDDYDHSTFLKFRNRHKGKSAFLRELYSQLPTKTEQEIRDHEKWFQKFLELNEQKKSAIQKWRDGKEVERHQVLMNAEGSGSEDEVEVAQKEAKIAQERAMRKEGLNAWRLQKELERAEKEEAEAREKLRLARAEEKRRAEQEAARAHVAAFRRERDADKRDRELQQEELQRAAAEEKAKVAQMEIARFQCRDLGKQQRKKQKELDARAEKEEKQSRLRRLKEQVEIHAPRDPSRLLQPTRSWRERERSEMEKGGQVFHNQVQHRAVPSWRQGIA